MTAAKPHRNPAISPGTHNYRLKLAACGTLAWDKQTSPLARRSLPRR